MCPTEEEMALVEIQMLIAARPEDDRIIIEAMAQGIRNIAKANSPLGLMALGLVGAEEAAKP